jgi:tetraacyldisaccharide 4'-kinase
MSKSTRNYFRRLAEGYEDDALSRSLFPFLEAASALYGSAVNINRSLYKSGVLKRKKLPFPVISVGNLTWGGTGKTPLVEFLARRLGERNHSVLVLTRGYGADESEQFKQHLPKAVIGVGKDRYQVAHDLSKKHQIGVAILDDGLQHWPIERDLEIITVNALNPFGNGKIIPRGILREPLTALSRANMVVISHANLVPSKDLEALKTEIRKHAPSVMIIDTQLEPLFFYRAKKRARVPLEKLEKQKVATFSGVGAPRSFQLLLSRLKMKPIRNFEFSDHHRFSEKELHEIKEVSQSASVTEIITTEKDYYRCQDKISEIVNPLILATRLRVSSGEGLLMQKIAGLLEKPIS